MTDAVPFATLDADRVRAALGSGSRWRLLPHAAVTSTNDLAADLAEAGEPGGAVVIAETQTRGRGRMRRTWHSPPGVGLWLSILLRPRLPAGDAYGLTVAAALAAARGARKAAGADLRIKWPNDLVGRPRGARGGWLKVGGLLAEGRSQGDALAFAIVGVGINVHSFPGPLPEEIAGRACAVEDLVASPVSREALLAEFLQALGDELARLESEGLAALLPEFRELSVLLGSRVEVAVGDEKFHGTAREIAADGALVVVLENGTERRLLAGEASLAPEKPPSPAGGGGRAA